MSADPELPGPAEDRLRSALAAAHDRVEIGAVDADAVLAHSRARRRPRQAIAAGVGALALAGILVVAVQTVDPGQQTTTAAGPAAEAPTAAGDAVAGSSELKRAPADKINLCTGAVSEIGGSATGLVISVVPRDPVPAGIPGAQVTVRLTNSGAAAIRGVTAAVPALTLSQNGVVLWHSNGPTIASVVEVDLQPGASLDYAASFDPVQCGIEDDSADAFRTGLPAVPPGTYDLSAVIDFTPQSPAGDAIPELDLISGAPTPVTIG